MDEKIRIVAILFLSVGTFFDLKYRRIPIWLLAAAAAGIGLFRSGGAEDGIFNIIGGIFVGILFLTVSKVTQESLGYADSFTILCMGIFLGFRDLMAVLAITFFLLLWISVIILARRKMSKKSKIPFFPFFTVSYLIWIMGGGRF